MKIETMQCTVCGRVCSVVCDTCDKPVCTTHRTIFEDRTVCRSCVQELYSYCDYPTSVGVTVGDVLKVSLNDEDADDIDVVVEDYTSNGDTFYSFDFYGTLEDLHQLTHGLIMFVSPNKSAADVARMDVGRVRVKDDKHE